MNLLHTIGLMTRAEHERKVEILDDLLAETRAAESTALAQFKRAATDLEKQAGEIEKLRADAKEWEEVALNQHEGMEVTINTLSSLRGENAELRAEINALRPDALAMRRKRQMDRDRRKHNG